MTNMNFISVLFIICVFNSVVHACGAAKENNNLIKTDIDFNKVLLNVEAWSTKVTLKLTKSENIIDLIKCALYAKEQGYTKDFSSFSEELAAELLSFDNFNSLWCEKQNLQKTLKRDYRLKLIRSNLKSLDKLSDLKASMWEIIENVQAGNFLLTPEFLAKIDETLG